MERPQGGRAGRPLHLDSMADGAPISGSLDIVTFGCRLNAYESEAIRAQARLDGVDGAIVFNTCAVTGEAVRQARQAIRKARREHPEARLIVTGCAAQIDPAAFAAMPEVDLVVGNAEKAAPGALLAPGPRVRVNDIMSVRQTAGHLISGLKDRARAYVEVQNGCDHRCTFCIIPFGRGNSRSAPAGEVVSQVRRLVEEGYREVVLTGVDMTSWGADLPGGPSLGNLVRRVLKNVPELERLREAGAAALVRHLDRQVGRDLTVLVEKSGTARAADFTEIALAADAEPGTMIRGRVTGHDGARAFLEVMP